MSKMKDIIATTAQTVIIEFHNRDDMLAFVKLNSFPDGKKVVEHLNWGCAAIEILDFEWQFDADDHKEL